MEERTLEDIEKDIIEKKEAESKSIVVSKPQNDIAEPIQEQLNNKLQTIFQNTVDNNADAVQQLADNAVKTEIEIKNEEIEGRKKVKIAEVGKDVAEAKTDEDEAQHKRVETILKSQGLTSRLPQFFRKTSLVIGYPFFVLYLLTFGWVIQMFNFIIKGFITMVADCVERFAEVNKKFIDNDNSKSFDLRKSMFNILKWVLIIGALITVVVLLVVR